MSVDVREVLGCQSPDKAAEQVLASCGIAQSSVAYAKIELSDIDERESVRNRGRTSSKLDAEVVVRYADQMRAGVLFPVPCVWDRGLGTGKRYVVAGGNHRLAAMKALKLTSCNALVFRATMREFFLVSRTLNTTNGKSLDDREKLVLAGELCVEQGWSYEDSAKQFGVSRDTVKRHVQVFRIREVLGVRSVDASGVSDDRLARLHKFLKQPPILEAAVRIAKLKSLNTEEMLAAVDRCVDQFSDEASRLSALNAELARWERTCPSSTRTRNMPIIKLRRSIAAMESLLATNTTMEALNSTASDIRELSSKLDLLSKTLHAIGDG